MSELYWITIFDNIKGATLISLISSVIFAYILVAVSLGSDDEKLKSKVKKILKRFFLPVALISVMVQIFIPTTKQAYIISGIGGIVEYVKSNDTAKQIPDKAIMALDKLMDEYLQEEMTTKPKGVEK